MPKFKEDIPVGFTTPTALPKTPEQVRQWRETIRAWWEQHPMRYDWQTAVGYQPFSPDFYAEIDRRFFAAAREFLPDENLPFDSLIDFASLRDKDVLEIGVGNGSHAQLLAGHARSFTGIDLTDYAVRSTSERLRRAGLPGAIRRMDAEAMEFADNSFDFIWSWGVIDHSADTRRVLQEMRRVLRPGGRAVTMVFHRNGWNYYIVGGLFHGVLRGDLFKTWSLHKTVQRYTDGALARIYSVPEWEALVSEFFVVERIQVFGPKTDIIPLPGGTLRATIRRLIPDRLGRFFTGRCRLGSLLVSSMRKPQGEAVVNQAL
jgi:SAM-dependent methyltransferase